MPPVRHATLVTTRRPALRRPSPEPGSVPPAKARTATGTLLPVSEGQHIKDLAKVDNIFYPESPFARSSYRNSKTSKPVSAFQWRVYDIVRRIPVGKVTTYGALAALCAEPGTKGSPRAVALKNNPFAPFVPCHRIVNADGYISGFDGDYGLRADMTPQTVDSRSVEVATRKGTKGVGLKVWKKCEMLAAEGVGVDVKGYVVGGEAAIWRG